MAKVAGRVTGKYTMKVGEEAARSRFIDLAAIAAATDDVESSQVVGEGRIRFILKEEKHGPYRFQADYTVWYRRDGADVVWTTETGNIDNVGRARISADGAGARVEIDQTVTVDVPVPAFMLPVIRPIIEARLTPGVRGWQERMVGE